MGDVMKYQCIKCGVIWEKPGLDGEGYSHGLCPGCLRETIMPLFRKRQRAEGNFDCYGKAWNGYCDQMNCIYYPLCTNHKPSEDDIKEFKKRLASQRQAKR